MRQPTLKQFNALVTVLETGRFSEAARRLNVTQPTLSQQIRTLEENLGGALIDRDGVKPTPLGEVVAERARGVLREVDDLMDAVRGAGEGFGGLIRLGVLPTVGPYLLPPVLRLLHERHPSLQLHIREERASQLTLGLRDGRYDMVLSAGAGTEQHRDLSLVRYLLLEDPVRLGVASDHPFAGRAALRRAGLQGQDMLSLSSGQTLQDYTEMLVRDHGARIRDSFEGSSLDALRQMVSIGMGVALFPQLYVRSEIERGNDVDMLDLDPPLKRHVCLYWRTSAPRLKQFEAFAAELRDAIPH
ncbi:MAG: LysR substrate-binding domain-containing protein [Pseudomonadota bacterium]